MDINKVLYDIDSDLTQEDLEGLKFLCTDLLPGRRLVAIKSNLELFDELKKQNFINEDNDFLLKELLYIIGQHRVLKKLNANRQSVQESLEKGNGSISLYRRMLYELYENVGKQDLEQIIFLLNLPSKFKENKSFLDILVYLEKQEDISENNVEKLETVLTPLSQGLIKIIKTYKEKSETIHLSVPSEDDSDDLSMPPQQQGRTLFGLESIPVQVVASTDSFPTDAIQSIGEHIQEVHGPANDEDLKAANITNDFDNLSVNEQTTIESYAMNRKHRGYCLIISNSYFMKNDPRPGTEKDEEFLKKVFTWLGFDVEIYNELTSQKIHDLMKTFQALDHADRDCFVCCIMTHGQSRAVLGTDNEAIPINDIVSYFSSTNCKTLAGKPKLFFIQACQGTNNQRPCMIEADAIVSTDDKTCGISIPNDADVLIGMSTVDGYYSFRHVQQGTWYIQTLCENLTKMVPIGEDILSILTKVNKDVSEKEHTSRTKGKVKQMPQPSYTLLKKLVFPKPSTPYMSTSQ